MIRWIAESGELNQVAFADDSHPLAGFKGQHGVRVVVRAVQDHAASGIGTPSLA